MIQFSRLSVYLCVNWFVLGVFSWLGVQSCHVGIVRVRHQLHPVVMGGYGGVQPGIHVAAVPVHHGRRSVVGGVLRQRHGGTVGVHTLHRLRWIVR